MAGGRPTKTIDWSDVSKLCVLQCTMKEIAYFCECVEETLDAACKRDLGLSFSVYYEEKRSAGRISLRRAQWQKALAGSNVMLIWLGKQYLDQSDKNEVNLPNAEIKLVYGNE